MRTRSPLSLVAGLTGVAALLLIHPQEAGAQPTQEDQPGWSCSTQGNRMCGPGNESGLVAGCYDDDGSLVAQWPCRWEVAPDGTRYLFTQDGEVNAYLAAQVSSGQAEWVEGCGWDLDVNDSTGCVD